MDINQPKQQLDTLIYHAFRYKLDQDDSTISELFLTFPNLIINAQTHVEDETLYAFYTETSSHYQRLPLRYSPIIKANRNSIYMSNRCQFHYEKDR